MTDLPVIAIRFALYADLMVLAGLVAFTLYGLTPEERASDALPLRKPACALALIGLVLSGIGMMALIAAMAGTSITAIDRETAQSIIGETAIGTAWIVRMVAMSGALAFALLGDQADSLLNHKCETIDKKMLHQPGPDFIDRVFSLAYQAANTAASRMENTMVLVSRGTPRLSVRLSVTSVPTTLTSITVSQ